MFTKLIWLWRCIVTSVGVHSAEMVQCAATPRVSTVVNYCSIPRQKRRPQLLITTTTLLMTLTMSPSLIILSQHLLRLDPFPMTSTHFRWRLQTTSSIFLILNPLLSQVFLHYQNADRKSLSMSHPHLWMQQILFFAITISVICKIPLTAQVTSYFANTFTPHCTSSGNVKDDDLLRYSTRAGCDLSSIRLVPWATRVDSFAVASLLSMVFSHNVTWLALSSLS